MEYGTMIEVNGSVDEVVERSKQAKNAGITTQWASQIFGHDTLTLLGLIGREVDGVNFGTAVTPIQPRHPYMLAAQALTVQSALKGRLTLGIGLSHQMVIENVFGLPFNQPANQMEEYLKILIPLLRGEGVAFKGEHYSVTTLGPIEVPGNLAPKVLVAALGTKMLNIAGRLASGTATWMTGLKTVESHVVPTIIKAAEAASASEPEIVVGLPVCVTEDKSGAKERAAKVFSIYGGLPSYRAMLDREGAQGPADIAIIGNADEVASKLLELPGIGATGFIGGVFGNKDEIINTIATIGSLKDS